MTRAMLTDVYNWFSFSEGFDPADLAG